MSGSVQMTACEALESVLFQMRMANWHWKSEASTPARREAYETLRALAARVREQPAQSRDTALHVHIDNYAKYYAEHHRLSIRDDMRYVAQVAIRWAQPAAEARVVVLDAKLLKMWLQAWHDKLGGVIDMVGEPDSSLRQMREWLRDVRDEMLDLSASLPAPSAPERLPTPEQAAAAIAEIISTDPGQRILSNAGQDRATTMKSGFSQKVADGIEPVPVPAPSPQPASEAMTEKLEQLAKDAEYARECLSDANVRCLEAKRLPDEIRELATALRASSATVPDGGMKFETLLRHREANRNAAGQDAVTSGQKHATAKYVADHAPAPAAPLREGEK